MMLERGPYVTAEDVGSYWERDDGSLWMLQSYCGEPTVTFVKVYPQSMESPNLRGGAVGSPITSGFTRLVREESR